MLKKHFSNEKFSGYSENRICACIWLCILQIISMFGGFYCLTKNCNGSLGNLDDLNVELFFKMSDLKKINQMKT